MNIVEAKALGLDELRRKKAEMAENIDRDPNVWTVVLNAISELEWEQQQTQAIEAKNEERAHQEITFHIPGVDFTALDPEVIELIQAIVHIDRKKLLQEHGEEVLSLQTAVRDAEKRADEAFEEAKGAANVRFELTIMTEQRDNAARLLEEANAEVERLKSHVDDLRNQIAVGVRNAEKVIDIKPEQGDEVKLQDIMKRLEEKKRQRDEQFKIETANSYVKVTVKEKVNSNTIRVVLATTGEEKLVNWIDQGKYVLVSEGEGAEERARFQAEQAELSAAASQEVVAEPVTFPAVIAPEVQFETMAGVLESGEQKAVGGEGSTDQKTGDVTREEFEALKARVAKLEGIA